METEITESSAFGTIQETEPTGSRYKVRLIEGDKLGSTGYYPAEVLRRDGPKLFKAGTPMYLDHQTPDEKQFKPHGSVMTYAGELAEDAVYEGDGLYANVEIFEHQRPMIKALKDKIGISIRARGISNPTVIDGKTVPVFQQLTLARSADFVVKAGAGGKIVEILESSTEEEQLEESSLNMDDAVKAEFTALATAQADQNAKLLTALTEIAESLKAAPVEPVQKQEAEEVQEDALAIAKQLSDSTLSEEGRVRVLDLHKATKKPLGELIEAEEAYIKANTSSVEGYEEGEELEEGAKAEIDLPKRWKVQS